MFSVVFAIWHLITIMNADMFSNQQLANERCNDDNPLASKSVGAPHIGNLSDCARCLLLELRIT